MITLNKLFQLKPGTQRRKIALTYAALERDILGISERGTEYNLALPRAQYIRELTKQVSLDPKLPPNTRETLLSLLNEPLDERRICNVARNAMLAILGTQSAEWDLITAPHKAHSPNTPRFFHPGTFLYAEDIRSPFNLGSLFRTAECFALEKIYTSPECVSPTHPRAARSAMGTVEQVPWECKPLAAVAKALEGIPIIALETGGTPIETFPFPKKAIVIAGSEELGVSTESLKQASAIVSIKTRGEKASLNVGVAFGVLMQKWCEAIEGAPKPTAVD